MRPLVLLGALLLAAPAAAHQETVAYSRLVISDDGDVAYALKIPVEDLAESLGRQGHAALNAPEVRGAEAALFAHFEPLVGVSSGGEPCPRERRGIEVPEDDRLYGELSFVFHCPAGAPVTLDYRVFFDVDPGHMGMLEIETPGGKSRAELIIERPRWEVEPVEGSPPRVSHVEGAMAAPSVRRVSRAPAQSLGEEPAAPAVADVVRQLGSDVAPDAARSGRAPRRAHGSFTLLAVMLVVGAVGAFFTLRLLRRRPALPSRAR